MGNIEVVGNESLVEIGKAKEGLGILYLGGYRPLCNSIKLDRVHGKFSRLNKTICTMV